MKQGADLPSGDVDGSHLEKLDVRKWATVHLLEHLLGIRPLYLVTVERANDGLPARVRGRSIILVGLDVVSTGRGMELNPTGGRGAADKCQLVLFERKQDAVADDLAVVIARSELFGAVERKVCEGVEPEMGHEFYGIGAFNIQVHHVVREVEHDGALSPRTLFVAPVRVFGRDHRIDIGADLRIPEQVHRITGLLDQILEALGTRLRTHCVRHSSSR